MNLLGGSAYPDDFISLRIVCDSCITFRSRIMASEAFSILLPGSKKVCVSFSQV
jgi:hypothetical protein